MNLLKLILCSNILYPSECFTCTSICLQFMVIVFIANLVRLANWCCSDLYILTGVLCNCFINYWEKSVKFSNYDHEFVYFSLYSVSVLFMYFQVLCNNAYIFRIVMSSRWTFSHYEMSSFIFGNIRCFEVYFGINIVTLVFLGLLFL